MLMGVGIDIGIGIEDCKGNLIVDVRQVLKFGRIILQSTMMDLIDQKTWKLNLKRRWMQMRKALIYCKVKWKKLSRR
jgi:hypothetical protein